MKRRAGLFERLFAVQPEVRRRFIHAMEPAFKEHFEDLGPITIYQMEVVRRVLAGEEMTMGEFARAHGIGRSGATQLVDRLERRGLVARVRDQDDRRVQRVVATEAGRASAAWFKRRLNSGLADVLDVLDDAELETYVELAERIAGAPRHPTTARSA